MTLGSWLRDATAALVQKNIASAHLDAQLLLGFALGQSKEWVHTHDDMEVPDTIAPLLDKLLGRRLMHEPIPYIIGAQEFYRRSFFVSPDVLIPRPSSETIIDLFLQRDPSLPYRLLDMGTGSGCLAITLKLERPGLTIFASDISMEALSVAQHNASALGADVTFYQQDLLIGESRGPFHAIIANLPYVAVSWPRSPETQYEPASALYAPENGLGIIKQLLAQAPAQLVDGGHLFIEAHPSQHSQIITHASLQQLAVVTQQDFILVLRATTKP